MKSYSKEFLQRQPIGSILHFLLIMSVLLMVPIEYVAAITVDTLDDSVNSNNDCSLREAIQLAENPNSNVDSCIYDNSDIVFDSSLAGGTITLSNQLTISTDLTITGQNITLNGNNGNRVFHIKSGKKVKIAAITITNGFADKGGGILNEGDLTINNSTISANQASVNGGGIFNQGPLTINNSTVTNNSAVRKGGGIHVKNTGTAEIKNSIIAGNTAGASNFDCSGPITSDGYNLMGNGCPTGGTGDNTVTDINKVLDSFPTLVSGVHPLKISSTNPALNQIDALNGCGSSPLDQDQLGTIRPQGDKCDIGAYEFEPVIYHKIEVTPSFKEEDLAGTITFTVSRDGVTSCGTRISFNTSGVTLPPSPNADYLACPLCGVTPGLTDENITTGTISLLKTQQGLIKVEIVADNTAEPDEDLIITLSNPEISDTSDPLCAAILADFGTINHKFLPDSGSATFTIINDELGVTIERADPNPTKATTVNYTITFTEDVTGVDIGDFETSDANVSIIGFTQINDQEYTVTIDIPIKINDGDFQLKLVNDKTIKSQQTQLELDGDFIGETYTIDRDPPLVKIVEIVPDPHSTNVDTITIQFNEAVTNFDLDDLRLTYNGGSNLLTAAQTLTTNDDITWTLGNLSTLTQTPGDYELTVIAAGIITDLAGNIVQADATETWQKSSEPTLTITKSGSGSGTVTGSGIQCGSTCIRSYPQGELVTLTVTPDDNSVFSGWSNNCGFSFTIVNDTTCTARFNESNPSSPPSPPLPDTMTLTLDWEGNGQGEFQFDPVPQATDCDEETAQCDYVFNTATWVTVTAVPDKDSEFVKWSGFSEECYQDKGNQLELFMSDKYNCTAILTGKPKVLTLFPVGPGSGQVITSPSGQILECETGECLQFAAGSEVTLIPQAVLGSRFEKWSGDEDCHDDLLTMDTDKTCVATFDLVPTVDLTLEYDNNQGQILLEPLGEPCGTHCQRYNSSTVVTLTAQAQEGFRFTQWSGDCGNQTQTTLEVTLTKDTLCQASFTPVTEPPPEPSPADSHTLTITSIGTGIGTVTTVPTGINCGSECTATYPTGTTVTLVAKPDPNSTFAGWSEPCSQGQVHLDTDKMCLANFTAVPTYALAVVKTGSGGGTITSQPSGIQCGDICQASYPVNLAPDAVTGTMVTLTPVAEVGSHFTGWQEAGCDTAIEMLANKTCTAQFESAGTLQWLSPAQVTVSEEDESIAFTVSRLAGSYGTVSVEYTITAGSATAGSDYTATAGTLNWAAGDNSDKTITLTLLPDKLKEDTETVILSLINPVGAQLGTLATITVHIKDVAWFSSVQFASPQYTVNEGDKEAIVFVTRAGSRRWPISVDVMTVDGTAIANSDYQPIKETLTWSDGDRMKRLVKVPIIPDNLNEDQKSFTVRLSNLTGEAQFGPNLEATVIIINTPPAGSLEFAQAEYTVTEVAGEAVIQVNRLGDSKGAVSVNYRTGEGSAQPEQDYTPVQGVLNWADGEMAAKSFTIPVVSDEQPEGEETVSLSLVNPTGEAGLGALSTAILKITDTSSDDDNPPPSSPNPPPVAAAGQIQFKIPIYEITEPELLYPLAGEITLAVIRTGGSQGPVTVNYTTQDETAIAGKHYQQIQGQLVWADGETGEKEISVDAWNDNLKETAKSFRVILSNPTSGAILGEYPQMTVTITDDDSRIVQFSPNNTYLALESGGLIRIMVSRSDSTLAPITVQYTTIDGTATAGEDYSASSGILKWQQGEHHEQAIDIPIIPDLIEEGNETLQLSLFDPTGKIILPTPNPIAITITESKPNSCEVGAVIDCLIIRTADSPLLQNVQITPRGAVIGGTFAGQINNAGWIQDAFLLPETRLTGGKVSGTVSGDPKQPASALLRHVKTIAGTTLEHIVIGEGTQLDSQTKLGAGVRFETNNLIHLDQNLAELLGYVEQSIFGQAAVHLKYDVLYNSARGGVLGAINALPQLANHGWVLTQDPTWGYLYLQIGNLRYAALPLQVNQLLPQMVQETPLGLTLHNDGKVTFITHTSREIIAQPVIQAPLTLQAQLRQLGLNEAEMSDNGNLKLPLPDGSYLNARASLVAKQVSQEMPVGLNYTTEPISLVSVDSQGNHWQQFLYPAAAYPDSLYQLADYPPETLLTNEGHVAIRKGGRLYEGTLSYRVTWNQQRSSGLQLIDNIDINGDNCNDMWIDYDTGERQALLRTCPEH